MTQSDASTLDANTAAPGAQAPSSPGATPSSSSTTPVIPTTPPAAAANAAAGKVESAAASTNKPPAGPAVANSKTPSSALELGAVHVTESAAAPTSGSPALGYRVRKLELGPLGELTAQQTPLSVNLVSSDFLENNQTNNSSDAIRYVPTVYANTGASQVTPYYTIRGFSASTWTYNLAVDGMRTFDIYQPVDDKDHIEVINGPSGFLFGVTSPGGMVNYVTKRPPAENMTRVTLGMYDRQLFGHLDLGGHVAQAPSVGYRINATAADSGEAGPHLQSQERYLLSSAWDWAISRNVQLSVELSRAKRDLRNAQALFMTTAAIGIPSAPDSSKNWGAPYTGSVDATSRAGAAVQVKVGKLFVVRSRLRHSVIERQYALARQVWQNANYDYTWRLDENSPFKTRVNQANLFVDGEMGTGLIRHIVTIGGTYDNFQAADNGYRGTTFAQVYTGNLFGTPNSPPLALDPVGTSTEQRTNYSTVLLMDRIGIGTTWEVMFGATYANVDDAVTATATSGVKTTNSYDKSKLTPTASLSFKPIEPVMVYASYLEGLQQGFTAAPTTANAGQVFAPYVSKQMELGIKTSFEELNVNAAVFHISAANQYVNPTTNVSNQDGRAVHKGFELAANGRLVRDITLGGGLTVLSAKIDRAPTNVGKTPQGVPEKMARVYAEYDLPPLPGFTLTAGLSYTGRVPWDVANTLYVPAITLVDAGARLQRSLSGIDTTFRVNVTNLTHKDYWTTRAGILYLGSPRTVSLSVTLSI
jgi:iron complex outermembrane recepter protein